jgi:MFS family permease
MKLSSLFRGEYAFLKGDFLVLTLSWIIMYFAQPIPATYASLYYLRLGADAFLLSVIGFAGSIAVALVQFLGGYLADKHGRRWLIVMMTYGLSPVHILLCPCSFLAGHSLRHDSAKFVLDLPAGDYGYDHRLFAAQK